MKKDSCAVCGMSLDEEYEVSPFYELICHPCYNIVMEIVNRSRLKEEDEE